MSTTNYNWQDKVILIAEDEEINYIFLAEALRETNAEILHARDGQEAINLFNQSKQIDLILMDIKMPGVNGYDATCHIKEQKPDLPIIAQTAYALSGEKEQILNSGFDDYIAKPIKQEKLLEIIARHL